MRSTALGTRSKKGWFWLSRVRPKARFLLLCASFSVPPPGKCVWCCRGTWCTPFCWDSVHLSGWAHLLLRLLTVEHRSAVRLWYFRSTRRCSRCGLYLAREVRWSEVDHPIQSFCTRTVRCGAIWHRTGRFSVVESSCSTVWCGSFKKKR